MTRRTLIERIARGRSGTAGVRKASIGVHRVQPLLFALLASLLATGEAFAVTGNFRPISFEHINRQDGLSQNSVHAILQDSRGFMWFGTESGLNRYDGHEIRQYRGDRRNLGALPDDFIWQIAEDAANDLWLATEGGGVVQWRRQSDTFLAYRHDPQNPSSLSSDLARALVIDGAGKLWVGTRGGGLNRLDPVTGDIDHFRHDPGNPASLGSDTVYSLYVDRSDRLWIGTDRGLNMRDGATGEFTHYEIDPSEPDLPGSSTVIAIAEDPTGSLWIGTDGGLIRLNPANGEISHYQQQTDDPNSLSSNFVRAIFSDSADRLWIGTEDGLNVYDRPNDRFIRYGHEAGDDRSLASDYVMSMYEDRGGNLWVGTDTGGVSKWNPRTWSLGHHRGAWLESADVTAFAADEQSVVWVGTMGAGLKRLNLETGDVRHYRQDLGRESEARDDDTRLGISDDRVMSLLRDRNGELWIGTMLGGLNRLDPASETITVFRHDADDDTTISADGIMSLYEDRRGDIWVGTYGGGVSRYDRGSGTFVRYGFGSDSPRDLSGSRATAITQDHAGAIWVGTDGAGLNRYNAADETFTRFRHDRLDPDSLSSDRIFAIHADAGGELWIGTGGHGLDRLVTAPGSPDDATFMNVDAVRSGLGSWVFGIQSDAAGRLWLSTSNGLGSFEPQLGALKVLRQSHGLQSDDFNSGAHHRGPDGRLYFGGPNGFNAFDPLALDENSSSTPVVLVDFQVLNQSVVTDQPYELLESVELGYDDKVVTFEFAGLNFTHPGENQYAYRLEGFDDDWVYAGRNRRITYTNLDAGSYVFRAKAANSDGVWTESGLSLRVVARPAPWATNWAYGLYCALVVMLLILGWRYQQHKLAREVRYSRQLEREVSDRTHQLKERNERLEELSRAKSEFLAQMSHEIRTPMNGVLGMTELLLGTELRDDQRGFAKTIDRSAKSLLEIINDILDVSKIEAGKLGVESVEFEIGALVDETMALLADSARNKGLEFLCTVRPPGDTWAIGDPLRLRQILVNLLANAIKFTDAGKVELRCLEQDVDADSVTYRFEVSDTGVGISQDKHEQIFEAFTQEDGSTTRRFGGTGLGLAISKQLVELMGGDIGVDSVVGEGATFWFTVRLPVAVVEHRQDDDANAEDTSRALDSMVLPRIRGRVLLAEDTPVNQTVAVAMLQRLGCSVEVVADGAAAIDRARARNIDLILMDCQMPVVDGFDATGAIRNQEPDGVRVPIVALTANAQDGDRDRCLAAGMDDYLAKPFSLYKLHTTLSRWLSLETDDAVKASSSSNVSALGPVDQRSLKILRELSGPDGEEILSEAVQLFLEDSARLMTQLRSAIAAGDVKQVHGVSHGLKSSSADLGAHRMAKICGDIEDIARNNGLHGANALYRKLTNEYPRVVAALRLELQKKSA